MLFFRRGAAWQRLMCLVAPLLVVSMLLWQRQTQPMSAGRAETAGDVQPQDPPQGISSEEWHSAVNEFQGVVDATFQCATAEMPAYWRLLKWVVQAKTRDDQPGYHLVSFNELVNSPNQWRGRPVQAALHICRIAECPAPANRLGIQRLYEVWGWSEDSHGSLYVVITPELPGGMSIGESVSERAIVSGYFYKVQGYLAAGSPSQSSSAAPLVIGRLGRWEMPVTAIANPNELSFGGAGILLAASFLLLLSQRPIFRSRQRQRVAQSAAAKLENWLDSHPVGSELA